MYRKNRNLHAGAPPGDASRRTGPKPLAVNKARQQSPSAHLPGVWPPDDSHKPTSVALRVRSGGQERLIQRVGLQQLVSAARCPAFLGTASPGAGTATGPLLFLIPAVRRRGDGPRKGRKGHAPRPSSEQRQGLA